MSCIDQYDNHTINYIPVYQYTCMYDKWWDMVPVGGVEEWGYNWEKIENSTKPTVN